MVTTEHTEIRNQMCSMRYFWSGHVQSLVGLCYDDLDVKATFHSPNHILPSLQTRRDVRVPYMKS
jgi:hypothetical protein